MKSLYESSVHTKIREEREREKNRARAFLNGTSKVSDMTSDKAVRIVTNDLTPDDRRISRNNALRDFHEKKGEAHLQVGISRLLKKVRAKGIKEMPVEIPEKIEKPPITPEAIQEWLSELGEVKIRQNEDNSWGASILGVTLENCLYGPANRSRGEIRGENPDQALRNYFGCTTTPGTHMQKGEEQFEWNQEELKFIAKQNLQSRDYLKRMRRKFGVETKEDIGEDIKEFLGAMPETRVVGLLDSLGEWNVNPDSYGKNFSGNESYDVRFDPDIRDAADKPYMGFGNTAGEAKRDLLRQLILDEKIKLDSVHLG